MAADLFTLTELASYLQRDLDTSTATLAQQTGQRIVRSYLRSDVTSATYTSVKLLIRPYLDNYRVDIPQRPLTAVSSVSVNGTAYVLGTNYAWDGLSPYIRLSDVTYTTAAFQAAPVAVVSYTAGYATCPEDIKGIALAVAGRQYDNPRGLRSEAIDDYSGTHAGSDADLAGMSMLPPERKILDLYRVRAGSVVPR